MSEFQTLQAALEQKRKELAQLEQDLKQAQRQRLGNLAIEAGFESTDALILALSDLATSRLRFAIQSVSSQTKVQSSPGGRRPRAVVNDELRERIREDLQSRKMTAAEVADRHSVSSSLINQMKRKLGLTKPRRLAR